MPYRNNSSRAGKWRLLSNSNRCLATCAKTNDAAIRSARWHNKSISSTTNLHSGWIHTINPIRRIHLSSRNGFRDDKVRGIMVTIIITHIRIIKRIISSNKLLEMTTIIFIRILLFRIRTIDLSLTNRDLLTLPQLWSSSWRGGGENEPGHVRIVASYQRSTHQAECEGN
jgi:hypothetical protein